MPFGSCRRASALLPEATFCPDNVNTSHCSLAVATGRLTVVGSWKISLWMSTSAMSLTDELLMVTCILPPEKVKLEIWRTFTDTTMKKIIELIE